MNNDNGFIEIPNSGVSDLSVNRFMAKVYGWMFFGLLITAFSGFAFISMIEKSHAVYNVAINQYFYLGLIAAELVLVIALSRSIPKIKSVTAAIMFIIYAAINGITISYICMMYAGATVQLAFGMSAFIFGFMSIFGLVTKSDLTSFGKLAFVGLVGVIVASIVNIFLGNPVMDYIICIVGLAIFIGLVAYDSQKIKTRFYQQAAIGGEGVATKVAIIGALELYLDFINIFLFILRLLGRKK